MKIEHVQHILEAEGLGLPSLNVLIPNKDNYQVLLMQPHGIIEADLIGVRHFDRDLARSQFGKLLSHAQETQADLVVTPEYSMPWEVLVEVIEKGNGPAPDKLWTLGCESINHGELEDVKAQLAPHAAVLYESIVPEPGRFLDPLIYVFVAPVQENPAERRLVVLVQFKTYPMGDADHFEINGLQCGTCIYQFGGNDGQEIKLVSLICSDALDFLDPQAQAVYDRGLVLHIQLNPKPRHELFRQYRDRLLRFHGDATEIICLNWARDVRLRVDGHDAPWVNIAGSAWYLKPDKFDYRDQALHANHKLGLYYTWLRPLRAHALFFNYEPATYLVQATKVAHIGVPAAVSRRRGPKVSRRYIWNDAKATWAEQNTVHDGFFDVIEETGNARDNIKQISDQNPLAAERLLALCAGKVGYTEDWHTVRNLDSCMIEATEIIFRLTFCQDTDQSACDFRTARLRRCGYLWNTMQNTHALPPALDDLRRGFRLDWSQDYPHQNAISDDGVRATIVYMGEECGSGQIEATAKRLAEFLHRQFFDPDKSLLARQRLVVWYRDNNNIVVPYGIHNYAKIDKTTDRSEFDIGRTE